MYSSHVCCAWFIHSIRKNSRGVSPSSVACSAIFPSDSYIVPSYPRATLWSTIELGTAIICACLPTYRPLLAEGFVASNIIKSWYSSLLDATGSKSRGSSKVSSNHGKSAFVRIDRHGLDSVDEDHLTEAVRGPEAGNEPHKSNSYPMNVISVQSRIEVV